MAVHRLDTVDSTNEHALRALAEGSANHGDVFLARRQAAGRGTRGRVWSSPDGGVYLSMVLVTDDLPGPGLWTIAGGLAALDVARACDVAAALDWPNDLVVAPPDGPPRKLGGILAESRDVDPANPPHGFVLGMGINVTPDALTPELQRERAVTCIAAEGNARPVNETADLTMEALHARVHQALTAPARLHEDFFAACLQAGEDVSVEVGRETHHGRFEALDLERGIGLRAPGSDIAWHSLAHVRSMVAQAR